MAVLIMWHWCQRESSSVTIELSDELLERLERHPGEDETLEDFIGELVVIYEQEGRFLHEGP